MRAGRLLAEDPPNHLLSRYGAASLEEVFLVLSSNQGPVDQGPVDQGAVDQCAGTLPVSSSSTEALHQSNGDLTTVRLQRPPAWYRPGRAGTAFTSRPPAPTQPAI